MMRRLQGRIVVLPSKTPNGDYIPGVIETHQVRGSNVSPAETGYQPRYSFYPENLDDDLSDLFNAGKLEPPVGVDVEVEDRAGAYHKIARIRKR